MAFEAILQQQHAPPRARWRRLMFTISVVLHGAAVAVGVAYSLWRVDELPLPTVAVTLASGLPPPPPPPPPAARKRSTSTPRTKPTPTQPTTLVQPQERPKETPKEEPRPDTDDSGEAGGVVGGVQGGVVGGVVGAPMQNTAPRMVSPQIGRGLLLIDPNEERYRVSLPPPLARAGMRFFAILRVCVSAAGNVTEVRILRGANPAIDSQIPGVLGRWRYRPFTIDGRPTPFCYMLRYEISSR